MILYSIRAAELNVGLCCKAKICFTEVYSTRIRRFEKTYLPNNDGMTCLVMTGVNDVSAIRKGELMTSSDKLLLTQQAGRHILRSFVLFFVIKFNTGRET